MEQQNFYKKIAVCRHLKKRRNFEKPEDVPVDIFEMDVLKQSLKKLYMLQLFSGKFLKITKFLQNFMKKWLILKFIAIFKYFPRILCIFLYFLHFYLEKHQNLAIFNHLIHV